MVTTGTLVELLAIVASFDFVLVVAAVTAVVTVA